MARIHQHFSDYVVISCEECGVETTDEELTCKHGTYKMLYLRDDEETFVNLKVCRVKKIISLDSVKAPHHKKSGNAFTTLITED